MIQALYRLVPGALPATGDYQGSSSSLLPAGSMLIDSSIHYRILFVPL